MCSLGHSLIVIVSALMIHMSKTAYDAVEAFPEFITEPRGDICIKVKLDFFVTR